MRATDWIHRLSADDVVELDQALAVARGRVRRWADVTREDFPLPRLGARLAAVGDAVEHGRGVALVSSRSVRLRGPRRFGRGRRPI